MISDNTMLEKIKAVNNYYFNIPKYFVNQTVIDTEMVDYIFKNGLLRVVAREDIKKATRITKFTGWISTIKKKTPIMTPFVSVNNKTYCGISYPHFLGGIGSLIREAKKKEIPNVKIELISNTLWVIASINISKDDELIRPHVLSDK